jgi:hypothetical protein
MLNDIGGVFTAFPKLRVAFAHGGGSFHLQLAELNMGLMFVRI